MKKRGIPGIYLITKDIPSLGENIVLPIPDENAVLSIPFLVDKIIMYNTCNDVDLILYDHELDEEFLGECTLSNKHELIKCLIETGKYEIKYKRLNRVIFATTDPYRYIIGQDES